MRLEGNLVLCIVLYCVSFCILCILYCFVFCIVLYFVLCILYYADHNDSLYMFAGYYQTCRNLTGDHPNLKKNELTTSSPGDQSTEPDAVSDRTVERAGNHNLDVRHVLVAVTAISGVFAAICFFGIVFCIRCKRKKAAENVTGLLV